MASRPVHNQTLQNSLQFPLDILTFNQQKAHLTFKASKMLTIKFKFAKIQKLFCSPAIDQQYVS